MPESHPHRPPASQGAPPSVEQIRAACRLQERDAPQWRQSEAALIRLRERMPELDVPAVLCKIAAVNTLYGTNLYAVQRMAEHIVAILFAWGRSRHTPELVERLARLHSVQPQGPVRTHRSFASKFAHFFLDAGAFPIFDRFACATLARHLGAATTRYEGDGAYVRFVEDLVRLKSDAAWTGSPREFDRYLWLAGAHRAWLANPKAPINAEARALFESPSFAAAGDLALLGT